MCHLLQQRGHNGMERELAGAQMIKLKYVLLAAVLAGTAFNVIAEKNYAAIVPNGADTFALVSISEKICEAAKPNAVLVSLSSTLTGCWVRDGDFVKLQFPNVGEKSYQLSEFKYMGDTSATAKTESEKKTDTSVTLTCVADAWTGDVIVERNADGSLKKVFVSGEQVTATEQASAINFSFNSMNISLSTITGAFNYDTSGIQKYLNQRLLGFPSAKGAGVCRKNSGAKQF
jgi:hypothetical protein